VKQPSRDEPWQPWHLPIGLRRIGLEKRIDRLALLLGGQVPAMHVHGHDVKEGAGAVEEPHIVKVSVGVDFDAGELERL
jgi:hypothetical protein